jgi:hypothetical protein
MQLHVFFGRWRDVLGFVSDASWAPPLSGAVRPRCRRNARVKSICATNPTAVLDRRKVDRQARGPARARGALSDEEP